MNKSKLPKIRNLVKKYADEFCKPSRFRDKKNDFQRNSKHRKRPGESEEVPNARPKREREKYTRESKDWSRYIDEEEGYYNGMEPEADSPTTEQV